MLESYETNANPPLAEPGSVVSKNRVTPEELTKALAEIERRKQAEARRIAETISLTEAVTELHLEATPEEIWTEVEKQRAQAAALPRPTPIASAPQVMPTPPQTNFSQIMPRIEQNRGLSRSSRPLFAVMLISFALLSTHTSLFRHLFPPKAVASYRPLAQIPDGQDTYVDTPTLMGISEGKITLSSQIPVDVNQDRENHWTLVKKAGHVYLRGFVLSADSLAALRDKPLNVYNDDNSGELYHEKTSVVTLPVDDIPLQKSDEDNDYSEITILNFQPDAQTTLSSGR